MNNAVSEVAIMILSGVAITLVNSSVPGLVKLAPVFGLASQYFWLRDMWCIRAWGKFTLSIWFTAAWAWGLWTQWGE